MTAREVTLNGAEMLLKAAVDAGVEVCFANPGTSEMHFVSALDTVWGMRGILGLHETVCTGAADGYGRMTRKPAMTLLHLGPGLANGLCNLHNARRASTPIINLIGDMATWHKEADPLLNMDITALATTVSKAVIQCSTGDDLYKRCKSACEATALPDTVSGSRVSTVIVPHDLSWERQGGAPSSPERKSTAIKRDTPLEPGVLEFLNDCAAALKQCNKGKAAFYIGGRAGIEDDEALLHIGRIAAATGAVVYCENAFSRLDRGSGRPVLERLPYFPHDAVAALNKYDVLVIVDTRRPVANFGYEGGPSQLVQLDESAVWEIDSATIDVSSALEHLSKQVGGSSIKPLVNCRGAFCSPSRPGLPKDGRLNATSLCQTLAALQPENAIIVDESLTSGNSYWEYSKGCPPFSHLALTGGAIGCGPPMAVGAAVACPSRTVINFQADGSCMYSLQALWTQARENLHVVTVICANRAYAILKVEMVKQRITPSNGNTAKRLTEIGEPALDWVSLATGMGVAATRAKTVQELTDQFNEALQRQGPSLIEAVLQ